MYPHEVDSKICSIHIYKRKRVSALIVDETIFKWEIIIFDCRLVQKQYITLSWNSYIPRNKHMFVAENSIKSLVEKHGKHTVYTEITLL